MDKYSQATVNTALHLSAIGVLDRENAQICGVSVAAIRNWRQPAAVSPTALSRPQNRVSTLPRKIYG